MAVLVPSKRLHIKPISECFTEAFSRLPTLPCSTSERVRLESPNFIYSFERLLRYSPRSLKPFPSLVATPDKWPS